MRHKKTIFLFASLFLLGMSIGLTVLLPFKPKTAPSEQPQIMEGGETPTPEKINTAPCVCPFTYDPVCGTDFISYKTACDASCVDVEAAYQGLCKEYDPNQPLPAHCEVCSVTCPEGQVFFENNQGCPVCSCRTRERSEGGD